METAKVAPCLPDGSGRGPRRKSSTFVSLLRATSEGMFLERLTVNEELVPLPSASKKWARAGSFSALSPFATLSEISVQDEFAPSVLSKNEKEGSLNQQTKTRRRRDIISIELPDISSAGTDELRFSVKAVSMAFFTHLKMFFISCAFCGAIFPSYLIIGGVRSALLKWWSGVQIYYMYDGQCHPGSIHGEDLASWIFIRHLLLQFGGVACFYQIAPNLIRNHLSATIGCLLGSLLFLCLFISFEGFAGMNLVETAGTAISLDWGIMAGVDVASALFFWPNFATQWGLRARNCVSYTSTLFAYLAFTMTRSMVSVSILLSTGFYFYWSTAKESLLTDTIVTGCLLPFYAFVMGRVFLKVTNKLVDYSLDGHFEDDRVSSKTTSSSDGEKSSHSANPSVPVTANSNKENIAFRHGFMGLIIFSLKFSVAMPSSYILLGFRQNSFAVASLTSIAAEALFVVTTVLLEFRAMRQTMPNASFTSRVWREKSKVLATKIKYEEFAEKFALISSGFLRIQVARDESEQMELYRSTIVSRVLVLAFLELVVDIAKEMLCERVGLRIHGIKYRASLRSAVFIAFVMMAQIETALAASDYINCYLVVD